MNRDYALGWRNRGYRGDYTEGVRRFTKAEAIRECESASEEDPEREYCILDTREGAMRERHYQALRRLENNPMLTQEAREAVGHALMTLISLRGDIVDLENQLAEVVVGI